MIKEIKKRLIKEVIKPFFKENGFNNKGVNFEKDICTLFTIIADIQSQRYYKTPGEENFRINCQIISLPFKEITKGLSLQQSFGGLSISHDNSWITITESSSYENIAEWLRTDLNRIIRLESHFLDTEVIIRKLREEFGIQYAYLLQYESKKDDLSEWVKYKKEEIIKLQKDISDIETEVSISNLKPDSLDKELRTDGLLMKMAKIYNYIQQIKKEIDLITTI